MSSKYDTKSMRDKLRKRMAGKAADPTEFRVPKSTGDILKFRFFILPPMKHGEPCTGPAGASTAGYSGPDMDYFYVPYGSHWVQSRPYTCPRVISEDTVDCKMCSTGFSLFKELKGQGVSGPDIKAQMRAIARQWLPISSFMVNIYFPPSQINPEELHNKVMWFRASKTVWQHWSDALNRDDLGDPEDPQAFGAFFDEEAAFLYELQVGRSGEWNEYKTSKFIVGSKGARPIAVKSDGSPDWGAIKRIMGQRHDLYQKIEPVVEGAMDRLAGLMVNGDDTGFDQDETRQSGVTQSYPSVQGVGQHPWAAATQGSGHPGWAPSYSPASAQHVNASSQAAGAQSHPLVAHGNTAPTTSGPVWGRPHLDEDTPAAVGETVHPVSGPREPHPTPKTRPQQVDLLDISGAGGSVEQPGREAVVEAVSTSAEALDDPDLGAAAPEQGPEAGAVSARDGSKSAGLTPATSGVKRVSLSKSGAVELVGEVGAGNTDTAAVDDLLSQLSDIE